MPEKVRQNLIDKDMPEFNISIFAKYKPHKRWFTMRYTIVIAFAYGQYNVFARSFDSLIFDSVALL